VKKTELKQLIKPLVKECIHEVLIEEGFLSTVVAEVASGLQGHQLVEARAPTRDRAPPQKTQEPPQKLHKHRSNLMESIGRDAYNGIDLFEGTEPLHNSTVTQGETDLGDPANAGVDITAMVGNSSAIWQAIKQE
jgi:hypothetical protein